MDELINDKDEIILGDETKAIFGCLIDENSIDSSEMLHDNDELEYEVKREEDGHNGIITYRIVHLTDNDSEPSQNPSASSSSSSSTMPNKIKTNSNSISSTPPSIAKLENMSGSPPQYYILSPGDYTTSNDTTTYALSSLPTQKITKVRSTSSTNNNNNRNKSNSALSTIAAASGITTTTTTSPNGKLRNDRHRETHNAVERRRRNKINGLIGQLATLITSTDVTSDNTNNGSNKHNAIMQSTEVQSKGVILSKAYELIQKLQEKNESLTECLKENPRMMNETRALEHQNRALRKENETLREILLKGGIDLMALSNSSGISITPRPTPTIPTAAFTTTPVGTVQKLSTNQTRAATTSVQLPMYQQMNVTNLNTMHLLTSNQTKVSEKTNQIRESCIKTKQESTKGS